LESWQRTIGCGELRADRIGETITVNGWANSVRSHGGLVFIDLRDRTGIVQLRTDSSTSQELVALADSARSETVISCTGHVQARGEKDVNPKIPTGDIEINIERLELLNACRQPLPFQLSDESQMSQVNEELRLKYRYLDLRRPKMHQMLRLRHEVVRQMREFMYEREFLEIETPIMTKSTPEGARDYLVPYRLQPGLFYALPQAPQQFKQLLMVGGVERYFQIAKCFRDEAQRADRQPEFTQLDLEMSYVTQEDVLELVEAMTIEVVESCSSKRVLKPFPRFTYDEAMRRFGSDKPDVRFGIELVDLGEILANTEVGVFKNTLEAGGQVKAIRYPGGGALSRKEIDDLTNLCREFGAKGMAYFLVESAGSGDPAIQSFQAGDLQVRSPIAKFMAVDEIGAILKAAEAEAGDLVAFIADKPETVARSLDRLRREIGARQKLADPDLLAFCWIVDFPVFEWDEDAKKWTYAHNPFSMPKEGHMDWMESDPGRMRAYCYDIACNGTEWASGSIRIHKPEIQKAILRKLGHSEEKIQAQFGHMLEAFELGAPPHGGIAPGVDRLIMFMLDEPNIREVIAFPKMGGGYDPMMEAPSTVDDDQLRDLHLRVVYPPKKEEKS
jgi:aspartyl-tRNA synthetase